MPTLASATVGARLWLLVEYAGAWPSHLESLQLPEEISELVRRALERGIRPQLIRRPGKRTRQRDQGIRVLLAYAAGDHPWLASGVVAGPDDLDLDAFVAGVLPESCILDDEPVFLVCTHAKRNACCARIGLPLARSLAESLPDRVWETSHVGGDRYAANLVCLPHGIFYGSMSQAAALAAANAYRSGEVILDRLRGAQASLSHCKPSSILPEPIRESAPSAQWPWNPPGRTATSPKQSCAAETSGSRLWLSHRRSQRRVVRLAPRRSPPTGWFRWTGSRLCGTPRPPSPD
ncbi:sucrase ferredoxin [Actinomadura sp. ATCC 39365]